MRVKTYRGPNLGAVMAQIKADLGPDAVILSTQTLTENGQTFCEIMAAQEAEEESAGAESRRTSSREDTAIVQFQREWTQVKSHLLAFMNSQINLEVLTPRQRQAMEYLEREGVDANVLLTLWRKLKDDKEASLLSILGEFAPVIPWGAKKWPQRFQTLCGPHGVGKTSTLVRLALKRKRYAEPGRICLVNADHGQSKGRLVLRHYAELSGMVYREIMTPEDFQKLRAERQQFDRIFIDLPALPGGRNMEEYLREMGMDAEKDMAVHLVLSPHFSAPQLQAFLRKYGVKRPGSLVWTKIDEACTFGAIINIGLLSGLPISAISHGPGLRNSLAPAENMLLWKLIFKHELPQHQPRRDEPRGGAKREDA